MLPRWRDVFTRPGWAAPLPQLLFGLGCVLLKAKRDVLSRDVRASPRHLVIGMGMVLAGLVGNILRSPKAVAYFVRVRVRLL